MALDDAGAGAGAGDVHRYVGIDDPAAAGEVASRSWGTGDSPESESESESEREPRTAYRRHRRLDTYGDSLVHSNKLISGVFGRRTRKVPAHMPHLIDRIAMHQLQRTFPAEFQATSAHRFRSSADVQYAFAYMWWLIEGGARRGIALQRYWQRELDTDGDGFLSETELRTLASVVKGGSPDANDVLNLRGCLGNVTARDRGIGPVSVGGTETGTVEQEGD